MNDNILTFIFLCLAVFRIYLEVIGFNFEALPITSRMNPQMRTKFHKTGLFFCVGYIILFAPEYLFYS